MVQLIKSMMGGWEISSYQDETPRIFVDEGQGGGGEGGRRRGGGGWRDDRMQLKLPEETAATLTRCFSTCNLNLVLSFISSSTSPHMEIFNPIHL